MPDLEEFGEDEDDDEWEVVQETHCHLELPDCPVKVHFRKQRKSAWSGWTRKSPSVNNIFFKGNYEKTLGTTIFFDGNSKAQSMVGQEVGKTERKLLMKEVHLIKRRDSFHEADGRRELSVGFAEGNIEEGKTRLAVSWWWDNFTSDATYCAEENCQFIQKFQISFFDLIWSRLERLFLRETAQEFRKRRAKKLHCSEGNDGLLIYNAGRTSHDDRPALPVHIPTDQEIEQMIKRLDANVRSVFADLGLPAGICLARSTKDGFCPEV
ncbi:Oidioi.mRNA.OKI2018_I69.chr1.g1393.t1.cds [Oikopleura dioica]|uniref:Oidioi.mRNA.OKI2018_I69.chr1.g1391.t1.cds n=1 Tax=Oikopleura dioica TaxID=34765 RepID=A0ABN7SMS4_OIKDI|nr:Oidioi.mRNA.OKI2018_I69.chr1.g1391.t1.cds [Oikopleura dioica]CAG5104618.1 Oidioi.mRNA.OKI2018_I69.chr1.g1393.t1.cds [Oikopleura dioica]